ncbi:hypothetical protein HYQ46_008957 [Verticillium longisporum]|nr:hypothetical protein HYQ46_008957 [Verticillium longisporum]
MRRRRFSRRELFLGSNSCRGWGWFVVCRSQKRSRSGRTGKLYGNQMWSGDGRMLRNSRKMEASCSRTNCFCCAVMLGQASVRVMPAHGLWNWYTHSTQHDEDGLMNPKAQEVAFCNGIPQETRVVVRCHWRVRRQKGDVGVGGKWRWKADSADLELAFMIILTRGAALGVGTLREVGNERSGGSGYASRLEARWDVPFIMIQNPKSVALTPPPSSDVRVFSRRRQAAWAPSLPSEAYAWRRQ